jgi:hypothetical protein
MKFADFYRWPFITYFTSFEELFDQLKEGKMELTFGFSDMLAKANPEALMQTFNRMNP